MKEVEQDTRSGRVANRLGKEGPRDRTPDLRPADTQEVHDEYLVETRDEALVLLAEGPGLIFRSGRRVVLNALPSK